MMSGFLDVWGKITSAFGVAPEASTSDPLADYLEANSQPFASLRTGGVIHKITPGTAASDAAAIRAAAKKYGRKISELTSYVEQESRGDDHAENPNRQVAKPGESAAQAFAHEDVGAAELDGATLEAMPELKGASIATIAAKAFDSMWAIDKLASIVVENEQQFRVALKTVAVEEIMARIVSQSPPGTFFPGNFFPIAVANASRAWGFPAISAAPG